ncbi:MAG: hypothetical protein DWQ01_06075 [Planctomycetota bacterium]|nr:MAG: hypothetical protein DWQ01_06075 [Planctomycetota bacterium]
MSQFGTAQTGFPNFLDEAQQIRLIQAVFEQIAVTKHRHQQIIEVVSDAGTQLSQGFHLLRMAKLSFQGFALGNVAPYYV